MRIAMPSITPSSKIRHSNCHQPPQYSDNYLFFTQIAWHFTLNFEAIIFPSFKSWNINQIEAAMAGAMSAQPQGSAGQ
jgi:hypothetical protein